MPSAAGQRVSQDCRAVGVADPSAVRGANGTITATFAMATKLVLMAVSRVGDVNAPRLPRSEATARSMQPSTSDLISNTARGLAPAQRAVVGTGHAASVRSKSAPQSHSAAAAERCAQAHITCIGLCIVAVSVVVVTSRSALKAADANEQAERLRRRARRLYRKRLAEVVVAQWKRVAHGRLSELRARKCHQRQARRWFASRGLWLRACSLGGQAVRLQSMRRGLIRLHRYCIGRRRLWRRNIIALHHVKKVLLRRYLRKHPRASIPDVAVAFVRSWLHRKVSWFCSACADRRRDFVFSDSLGGCGGTAARVRRCESGCTAGCTSRHRWCAVAHLATAARYRRVNASASELQCATVCRTVLCCAWLCRVVLCM